MSKLLPFKKGERVCFIGDSITQGSYWIAHIAEHYAKVNPEDRVDIFPCGVGGGSCLISLHYLKEQTAIWSPTTAVIMLGMNDIYRNYYVENPTESDKKSAEKALLEYEMYLQALSHSLKALMKIERIIYLAPTPYDELQKCDTPVQYGCWKALRRCAEIMQKMAEEFDGEFYDFGGEFYKLLKESYEKNSPNTLIMPDRVHPNEFGNSVMARLFLTAQGFEGMAVTTDMICDGSAKLSFGKAGEKYYNCACDLQLRWQLEWLMTQFFTDNTDEGKKRCTDNFKEDHPNCSIDEAYWAANYWRYRLAEEENKKGLLSSIEEMYS